LDEKMLNIAKVNISKLKFNNTPIEFINIDANNFHPIEGTILFMFNPFGEKTFKTVINNLKDSLTAHPRRIRIVYHHPKCGSILDTLDWLEFEGVIERSYFCTSVWRNKLS